MESLPAVFFAKTQLLLQVSIFAQAYRVVSALLEVIAGVFDSTIGRDEVSLDAASLLAIDLADRALKRTKPRRALAHSLVALLNVDADFEVGRLETPAALGLLDDLGRRGLLITRREVVLRVSAQSLHVSSS